MWLFYGKIEGVLCLQRKCAKMSVFCAIFELPEKVAVFLNAFELVRKLTRKLTVNSAFFLITMNVCYYVSFLD